VGFRVGCDLLSSRIYGRNVRIWAWIHGDYKRNVRNFSVDGLGNGEGEECSPSVLLPRFD
jgi:hypothetical protein